MEYDRAQLSQYIKRGTPGITGDHSYTCLISGNHFANQESALQDAHACLRAIDRAPGVRLRDAVNLWASRND